MVDALAIHRVGNWLFRHKFPLFPKILQGMIFLLFNSYIPYQLRVGKGARLGHRGIAVVINRDAIIGENVLIRAHVTIGKKSPEGRAPVIGDNVEIGDGAKIIGEVRVGNDAVIGANAVVLKDVPPGSLAVGVPAHLVQQR